MFWHKKQRSPPLPRLTSSIPEMEQYLATMDSTASNPSINKFSSPTVAPEDLAASIHNQDCGEVQADSKPVPDLAQPRAAATDTDLKVSLSPATRGAIHSEPISHEVTRNKAQRSRPRFLVLVTCISYLLFQALGVGLGLRLINGYAEPRHQQVEDLVQFEAGLQALRSDLTRDCIVPYKLELLWEATMDRQYQENYEACLNRGLYNADKIFLGFDFSSFPETRNQTMDWVMSNCDRLHFAPAVATPDVSKFLAMIHRLLACAENFLSRFEHKAPFLKRKIHFDGRPPAAKQLSQRLSHNSTTLLDTPRDMPFGFELDCEGRTRCRLTHSGPYRSIPDDRKTSEAIAKLNGIYQWSLWLKKALNFNNEIVSLLALWQSILLICYLATVRLSSPHSLLSCKSPPKTPMTVRVRSLLRSVVARLTQEEKLALGLVINTALYALLHYEFDFVTLDFDVLLFPVGLGLCAFHAPQAVEFFVDPTAGTTETLLNFCRASYEICLIARDDKVADPTPNKDNLQGVPVVIVPPTPASKIGSRFISPLTSIAEDLRQEREAMLKSRNDVEPQSGYATDTDSDYDSDIQHASYVDLTGGATPTVLEDGGEWAVVEG